MVLNKMSSVHKIILHTERLFNSCIGVIVLVLQRKYPSIPELHFEDSYQKKQTRNASTYLCVGKCVNIYTYTYVHTYAQKNARRLEHSRRASSICLLQYFKTILTCSRKKADGETWSFLQCLVQPSFLRKTNPTQLWSGSQKKFEY